jgi:hypothetical protein
VFEQEQLLPPAEIRALCQRLQSQNAIGAGRASELVTFEIPCEVCNAPMRPQPGTDRTSALTAETVLTCPQCGNALSNHEPASAANDNPHKSPPRFQHP